MQVKFKIYTDLNQQTLIRIKAQDTTIW